MPYADPAMARAVKRESARRRRTGEIRPARRPKPELAELRYRRMADLLAVLGDEIDRVREAELDLVERARLLGYLVGVASRLIEGADLELRLAEVERTLAELGVGNGQSH